MNSKRKTPDTAPATAEQVRADIDRGLTGEKVAFPDPAMVPLGTDAEAGGTPPTAQELRIEAESRPTLHKRSSTREDRGVVLYVFLIGLIAVAICGIAVFVAGTFI